MIIPDINLLVYAYDAKSRFHQPARKWWEGCLSGPVHVGLAWATIMGFIRITTNPRIAHDPVPVGSAIRVIREWLNQPNVQLIHPGGRYVDLYFGFLETIGAGGNLTTDAHLASLAVEYQAELHTNDADFTRFTGLRWINPLTDTRPKSR